ncbi:MAG: hypothetical protein ACI97A_001249 [Planctomycetota bacterium]|jgi:uncharacterized protein (TIGR01777 family)
MRILMTGSTGLVGRALSQELSRNGHEVVPAIRSFKSTSPDDVVWDHNHGIADVYSVKGIDAVVHLAGENVASGRWTKARKERIRDSRIEGTTALCKSLALLDDPPKILVAASAVGFYGDRGDEVLDEEAVSGKGFLADVSREWEAATKAAEDVGIRVVKMRLGAVLSREGGALKAMLPPFKMGVGGKMGSGSQYMAWITLRDAVRAFALALQDESLSGPVNVVAPQAITNLEFTKAMGRALKRPTIFPLPGFMAKLVIGEMADELLLSSMRVTPKKLEESGFQFADSTIDSALESLLGKTPKQVETPLSLTSEGALK